MAHDSCLDTIRLVAVSTRVLSEEESKPLRGGLGYYYKERDHAAGNPHMEIIYTCVGSEEGLALFKTKPGMYGVKDTTYNGRPAITVTRHELNPTIRDYERQLFLFIDDHIQRASMPMEKWKKYHPYERTNNSLRLFPMQVVPFVERVSNNQFKVGVTLDFDPKYNIPVDQQKLLAYAAHSIISSTNNNVLLSDIRTHYNLTACWYDSDLGIATPKDPMQDIDMIINPSRETHRGLRHAFECKETFSSKPAAEKVAKDLAALVGEVCDLDVGNVRGAAVDLR